MPEDTADSGGAAKTVPPAAGHLADGSSYREGQTVPLLDGDHEKVKKNRNTNLIDFEEEGDQVEDSDDKDTTTAVYIAGRTALSNSEVDRGHLEQAQRRVVDEPARDDEPLATVLGFESAQLRARAERLLLLIAVGRRLVVALGSAHRRRRRRRRRRGRHRGVKHAYVCVRLCVYVCMFACVR